MRQLSYPDLREEVKNRKRKNKKIYVDDANVAKKQGAGKKKETHRHRSHSPDALLEERRRSDEEGGGTRGHGGYY